MADGRSGRPRVLVVDDDAQNRERLRAWLEPAHEVVQAADGPAAIAALEQGGIDLVLLDASLQGMSGVEACRAMRRIRPGDAFLPILLMIAESSPQSRIEGIEAGADGFLALPCDRTELTLRTDAFLRTRRQDLLIRAQLAELKRVSALKDDLIALVAHDLRGPLASVLTLVGIAREEVQDPEVRKDLEVALSSAERAREIAEDLLQVRLLEHGEHALARASVPAEDVVRDAIRPLEATAGAREVGVRVSADADTTFLLDAPLVRRAVQNLAANAIRHAPPRSTVEVSIRRVDGALEIAFVDRGPEVPAAAQGDVFHTFAAVERRGSARRAYGLGLYLVRLVAEVHGGGASAGDAPGGGAVFRMRLEPPPPSPGG